LGPGRRKVPDAVSRTTSPAYIFPKSRKESEIALTNSEKNSKSPTKIITKGVKTEIKISRGLLKSGLFNLP
jgi:hypothetical protein